MPAWIDVYLFFVIPLLILVQSRLLRAPRPPAPAPQAPDRTTARAEEGSSSDNKNEKEEDMGPAVATEGPNAEPTEEKNKKKRKNKKKSNQQNREEQAEEGQEAGCGPVRRHGSQADGLWRAWGVGPQLTEGPPSHSRPPPPVPRVVASWMRSG